MFYFCSHVKDYGSSAALLISLFKSTVDAPSSSRTLRGPGETKIVHFPPVLSFFPLPPSPSLAGRRMSISYWSTGGHPFNPAVDRRIMRPVSSGRGRIELSLALP